jgi:hypothetical protein
VETIDGNDLERVEKLARGIVSFLREGRDLDPAIADSASALLDILAQRHHLDAFAPDWHREATVCRPDRSVMSSESWRAISALIAALISLRAPASSMHICFWTSKTHADR